MYEVVHTTDQIRYTTVILTRKGIDTQRIAVCETLDEVRSLRCKAVSEKVRGKIIPGLG